MIPIQERKIHLLVYKHLNSLRKTSKYTNASKSSISRWNKENGLVIKYNLRKNIHIQFISKVIEIIIETQPFSTVNDLLKIINTYNIPCSYGLIRNIMTNELKLSYKKIKYANYSNELLLKEKTDIFCTEFKKIYKSTSLVASLDEVGFNSRLTPLYAWSRKGKVTRIKNKLQTGSESKNKSICCCITSDGKMNYRIEQTPYNIKSFLVFLKQLDLPQNTILLMDNVRFHHSQEVKNYIESKEWKTLYTPPYSPWFNPIENVFGIIKNNFRKNKSIVNAFNIISKNTIIKTITSGKRKTESVL